MGAGLGGGDEPGACPDARRTRIITPAKGFCAILGRWMLLWPT